MPVINNPLTAAQTMLGDAMRNNDLRIQLGTENYVNAKSTASSPDEDPYTRKQVTFKSHFDRKKGINTVAVDDVSYDDTEFPLEYMPGHPAANEQGMVKMPNVKAEFELVDVQQAAVAQRATYQLYKLITEVTHRTHGLLDSVKG